jgi:SAM-dependent methyltransferase
MFHDNWLERWLPLAIARAGDVPVLEVACGHGDDTAVLAAAGLRVVAFDRSAVAVGIAKARVPSATIACRDLRDPFPEQARDVGVVVASLCLHYFGWAQTLEIAQRLRAVLRPGGVLLCRLNSTEDTHFGADGHPEIEPNYFLVDGTPKRFFDEASVRALFAVGWKLLSLEHVTTRKYVRSKALWEAIVERDGRAG